mmetsp:Transcript_2602/g.6856  ORF Transcript_2602/g.6856 Transcript_2602/m.6856 type:complete len:98 (-) Transcript_2602:224-517(-)
MPSSSHFTTTSRTGTRSASVDVAALDARDASRDCDSGGVAAVAALNRAALSEAVAGRVVGRGLTRSPEVAGPEDGSPEAFSGVGLAEVGRFKLVLAP